MISFLLCVLLLEFSSSCPNVEKNIGPKFRLPTNIKPISYDITLQPDLSPDLNPAPFNGSVKIWITPTEDTNSITLQIRQLYIDDTTVAVLDFNGNALDVENIRKDDENEFYIITTKQQLSIFEDYLVVIGSYEGTLNLNNAGFYLAKYMEDGVEKRFATTQFQSTSARRAYPSFDEPALKATFNITMLRPSHFHSISNEILLETTDLGNGISKDVFRESVVMSTYLLAFVVSEYDFVQKENQRVFARPQAVRDGWCEYALNTGLKTIQVLEDYLGVKYTLEKMDQVAIPDVYFSPGAMENWGLVTYRETYLLYSKIHSTTFQLQKICTIIAHEFGHQWFGNLVTLQWWRYTWLNEGFATYFELFGASLVEPTWRLMEQFVFDLHDALEYDSTNNTTPMNYENSNGGGAPTLITYDKGGSVIRMAEHFLTKEIFQKSLNIYLNKMQFSTSVPADLYDSFQITLDMMDNDGLLDGATVTNVLAPWTDQEGYPLVMVTRDYTTGAVNLKQNRFLLKNYTDVDTSLLWPIPINFMFSSRDNFDFSKTTADYWFKTREETLPEIFPTDGFVIANKQQTGFYRVNYDMENWARIINHLNSKSHEDIIPINRAQLIDDAFNFAKSGVINYEIALDLSKYMINELDYIPIKVFLGEVDYLRNKVAFSPTLDYFNAYIIKQLSKVAGELNFFDEDTDDHITKLNRVAVMTEICNSGDQDCLAKSLDSLRKWRDNDVILTPDTQQYVFCSALKVGDQDDWDFVYQKYLNEEVEFLKVRLLNALGCSGNEEILNEYMNKLIDGDNPIRKTDRSSAFATIYNSGNFGLRLAFEYLSKNFEEIKNSTLNINTIINGIGSKLNTVEHYQKLLDLANIHGDKYFETILRTVEENIEWNNKFLPTIHDWFVSNSASV